MKRPLIIGLSLAFVAFTMAASITSTVAWFSTTRVLTTSAGTFEVAQTDGSMECELTPGVGTRVTSDNKQVIIGSEDENVHHALLDGSVDLDTGIAYRKDRDAALYHGYGTPDPTKDDWLIDSLTKDGITEKHFVAVSWQITFDYSFNLETANVGVYLDLGDSIMTASSTPGKDAEGTHTEKSQYGFRIAFLADTGESTVFGNNTATASTLKYVNGEESTGNYSSSNYVVHKESYSRIADGTSGSTTLPERICTLTRDDPNNVVTCIAWFEGEDANVISGTQMDIMSAALSFYVRSDA